MKNILNIFIALAMCGYLQQAVAKECNVSANAPRVIAHRGYWKTDGSAQNSIRSLIKADSIGCYGSEFDVWLTADNELVVNHNRDINGKDIETGNSRELLREHLPNGELLPTLSQYLDAAKQTSVELILEVKPHRDPAREDIAVPMIVDMVAQKGLTDRTTYITFSRNAFDLLIARSGRPVYFLTGIEPDTIHAAGGSGPDFHINVFRKHPDWVNRSHQLGMPVNIWTIANAKDLQYCIDHEADFVTTDIPEEAIAYIAENCGPRELNVMTYNLHAGSDATVEELAKVILAENPDFVALQEVDCYTGRANAPQHNGHNFIAELAAATNMYPLYGKTLNFAGGYYGIGILSKHPCEESHVVELPNPSNKEPRVLLEGTFRVDGKQKVIFGCTHLSVEDEKTRVLQAEYINERYAECPYPVVIGGDFNSLPDSEPMIELLNHFVNLTDLNPTYPAVDAHSKIDYLLGSKGVEMKSTRVLQAEGKPTSDHCPVASTIIIP